jgi:DNA-directed RNA polymerase specialized sigma24 family protein
MSPARSRVGVSADAFVAVVRAYADRVHDDVRRLGCTPAAAAEVVETSALGLCERLRARPDQVGDLVGAWFRDARVYAQRVATGTSADADDLEGAGIVRRSDDDAAARRALAGLNERDRVALLLRDAYDLPYPSTAVALGCDAEAAARLVGLARLRFLRLAAGAAPDEPAGHDVELANAARLADGGLAPDASGAAERHAAKCPICTALLPAQREARRLLSGLAILAMPDADRDRLIARATSVATRLLPSAADVAAATAPAGDPGARLVPFTLVVSCLGGALLLGGLAGMVSGGGPGFGRSGAPSFEPLLPTATGSPTPTPSATATPTATRTATPTATPSRTAAPSATFTTSAPPPTFSAIPGTETIRLTPSSGPNGTTVQVHGIGWAPGVSVHITYSSALGPTGQAADVVPDRTGHFDTTIVALDPQNIPGPHVVRAATATQSAQATYAAT